jgi:hypothetical protein
VTAYCENRAACLASAALLIVENRLWCRFVHFKLCAHFLEARYKRFNLLLLAGGGRFLLLVFAMLFKKLVKQHCVHGFVAHSVDFAVQRVASMWPESATLSQCLRRPEAGSGNYSLNGIRS